MGLLDGGVGLALGGHRDLGDGLAGGGIDDVEVAIGLGGDELAADEVLDRAVVLFEGLQQVEAALDGLSHGSLPR